MKKINLNKVEHNVKIGQECGDFEPNITDAGGDQGSRRKSHHSIDHTFTNFGQHRWRNRIKISNDNCKKLLLFHVFGELCFKQKGGGESCIYDLLDN